MQTSSDNTWQYGNVRILILNCQSARLINQWRQLIKNNSLEHVLRTHALGWTWNTPRMIIVLWELARLMRWGGIFCFYVISSTFFSSPLALVLITSSNILELSTQLLVKRRTVYSVPGSSPSMMWKVLEEFSASDIFQLPSPIRRT